jgi:hypothetical protein
LALPGGSSCVKRNTAAAHNCGARASTIILEYFVDSLKEFRIAVVRYTLLLSVVAGGATWYWSPVVSKSVLMGGMAGTIGFWIMGKNIQKLASPDATQIQLFAVKWTFVRLLFYALAIYRGYTLDRELYHGLIAAVIGIFFVQAVMITLAFTSLDNTRSKE